MKMIKIIAQKRAISRQYHVLKNLHPRILRDCGFSPELVSMGKKAYPWREQI